METVILETECSCQEACVANPQCETFTFDYTSGICSLTGPCDSVAACETCVYGPPVCPRGESVEIGLNSQIMNHE